MPRRLPTSCAAGWVSLLLAIILLPVVVPAFAGNTHRVMVLHAYHLGQGGIDPMTEGLESALAQSGLVVELSHEFMDSKRFPPDLVAPSLETLFHAKYSEKPPDVLVTVGNNALDFMLKRRQALFPGIPLVVCGIDSFSEEMVAGEDQITGVVEDSGIEETLALILRLHPKATHIVSISDSTVTGRINLARLRTARKGFEERVEFLDLAALTAAELAEALHRLPSDAVLIDLGFFRDPDGRTFSQSEQMTLITAATDRPVYSPWDYLIGFGVIGGVVSSFPLEGQQAGAMVVQVLTGTPAEAIPVLRTSPKVALFDYPALVGHGIDTAMLPPGSVIRNQPASYYGEYRQLIWSAALVGLLLFGLLAILLLTIAQGRRAESARRASEAKYKVLFSAFPLGITVSDPDGRVIEANAAAQQLIGLSWEEYVQREAGGTEWQLCEPDGTILDPEALPSAQALAENRLVGNRRIGLRRDDGSSVWLEVTAAPIPLPDLGVAVTFTDVTPLVRAERALAQSERMYHQFFEQIGAYCFILDLQGNILEVNARALEILGCPREELLNRTVTTLFTDEARHGVRHLLERCGKGHPVPAEAFSLRGKESGRQVVCSLVSVSDGGGHPLQMAMVLFDITEWKRIEERFRIIYEQSPVGIVMVDPRDQRIVHCNRRFSEICGYEEKELANMTLQDITHPEDWQRDEIRIRRHMNEDFGEFRAEHRYLRKGGQLRWVRIQGVRLVFDSGAETLAIGSVEDITEQRAGLARQEELERHLGQVHRVEAIGMLAGGVAHDFNNILFPISGNAELLQEELPPDSPLHELVDEIIVAVERARDLVRQILAFSQQAEEKGEPFQPLLIIREALRLLETTLPRTIRIESDLDRSCRMIHANPTQLHQVAMNLFIQAYHAMMATGGTMTVRLANTELVEPDPAMPGLNAGRYVCLSVSDTGAGLSWEPLAGGHGEASLQGAASGGMEVGLLAAREVVRKQGGDLRVCSNPPTGKRCEVYFPVFKSESPLEPDTLTATAAGGSKSVLIVDDEESILRLEQQLLQRLGYRVTAIRDSMQALEVFRHAPGAFDAVITDMVMPKMGGDKLLTALLALRPDLPVIICTGARGSISRERAQAIGARALLTKPIASAELARVLAEAVQ